MLLAVVAVVGQSWDMAGRPCLLRMLLIVTNVYSQWTMVNVKIVCRVSSAAALSE